MRERGRGKIVCEIKGSHRVYTREERCAEDKAEDMDGRERESRSRVTAEFGEVVALVESRLRLRTLSKSWAITWMCR